MSGRTYQIVRMVFAAIALAGLFSSLRLPVRVRAESNVSASPLASAQQRTAETGRQSNDLAVEFEENRGQFDSQVRYVGRAAGSTVFLTATEAVYVLPMTAGVDETQEMFALRMKIVGANPGSSFAGEAKREHRTNYFKGNDPVKWKTNISNFSRVRYDNVYDGVSMVWHGRERGGTQYDFVVQPKADAEQITLEFAGADSLETDSEGNLLIHTKAGTVKHGRPFSFQETRGARTEVASSFVVENNRVKFSVGGYDRNKPLTIDPSVNLSSLAFSTFLGGEAIDISRAVTVDSAGGVYTTGSTTSLLFPTTAGAFSTSHTTEAIFVTKLNAIGTDLIYSTYLDGLSNDLGEGVAVDSSGNAYVTGFTLSADFPVTAGTAFDSSHNGQQDVFVTKLNATGSALLYSTFIGGNLIDQGLGIAIDSSGNAYVTGITIATTTPFPTTASGFDTTYNGANDVFLIKVNPSSSGAASLVYSTFLGGTANETGRGIAVDSSGFAYITGDTTGTDYPTTGGSFDTIPNGSNDVFLSVVNPAASGISSLVYSTYIGGDGIDIGRGVAVDKAGNAYITGQTANGTVDYPTTPNALDTVHNGNDDVFVTKINRLLPAVSQLVYSTYIGGSGNDVANSMVVDSLGNAYLTGETQDAATDYPTTTGAFDTTHNGNGDVFLTKLNSTGTAPLIYSSFIGSTGSVDDIGLGVAIDSTGNAYLTGEVDLPLTLSFPTTADAYQPSHNGGPSDGFVCKFGNFAITGRVIDSASGNPLAGVMVGMSGHNSNFMLTGADGRFGFTNPINNTPYSIAASRTNFNINPNIFHIDSLDANRDLIFIGENGPPSAANGIIDGQVSRGDGGPVAGVTISLTGSQTRKTVTDSSGRYRFGQVEAGGFYVVAPSRTDYDFAPANKSFSLLGARAEAAFSAALTSETVNPLDVPEFFVRQQYIDFLGREPDESGFGYWTEQINGCGSNIGCLDPQRITVSDAFFFEPEYQRTGSYVFRLYRAAFGNTQPKPNPDSINVTEARKLPSYATFISDRARVIAGPRLVQSQKDLANDFVQRPEFLARYSAGLSAFDFVEAILTTIRNDTGADLTSQRNELLDLHNEGGRAAVLYRLADDDFAGNPVNNRLFIDAEYNRAMVFTQYAGYLRRNADMGGFLFWLGQVNSGPLRNLAKQHGMVCSFITSAEYQRRFSSLVTHSNSQCAQ